MSDTTRNRPPLREVGKDEKPPEITGDGRIVFGPLDPPEMAKYQGYQIATNRLLMEIGKLRVRETQILGSLAQHENEAQQFMGFVAERLNIPKGTTWGIDQEGRAVALNMAPPPPPPPPAEDQ